MYDDVAIAVTTSGCGEQLIKTNLAREISRNLFKTTCPTTAVNKCFTEDFIRKYHNLSLFKASITLVQHPCQSTEKLDLTNVGK